MAIANIYDYHLGVVDDELVRHLESLPEDFGIL